uniref:Uncharacterized protein n=1 Tax=Rhizophora mucronata TaxID=61149 RepID=A0A2P2NPV7_RHIMU
MTSPTEKLSASSNMVLAPSLSELLSCTISVSITSLTWLEVNAPEKAGICNLPCVSATFSSLSLIVCSPVPAKTSIPSMESPKY